MPLPTSDHALQGPIELPPTTKVPLERANPLLSSAVGKWMKAHGKTVKPKLTEGQKADARMCFKLMDNDGSGALDTEELHAAFRLLGLSVSQREVEAILAEVDRDGSGTVEYPEFLEIMTMQLARLAEQQKHPKSPRPVTAAAAAAAAGPGSGAKRSSEIRGAAGSTIGGSSDSTGSGPSGGGAGDKAGGGANAGSSAVGIASALPFDVVATAYRRKKLMGALEGDDKDFIISMAAAAEEEEKLQAQAKAEAEAAAAAAAAERSGRALPSVGKTSATRRRAVSSPVLRHSSFLDSLSKEERRIIETLSRKFRDERDELAVQQAEQQRQRASPVLRRASGASPAGRLAQEGSHLAALKQTAAAAAATDEGRLLPALHHSLSPLSAPQPKPVLRLRPASAAAVRHEDFNVQYRLNRAALKAAAAAAARSPPSSAAPGAAEGGTEGLLLAPPLYSMAGLEPGS